MEGNCTLVPGGSSALNRLKMRKAEKEKCVVVFHMFDYSEPSLNIILQGELMLIPGGSTAPNLLEPLILLDTFSACAEILACASADCAIDIASSMHATHLWSSSSLRM